MNKLLETVNRIMAKKRFVETKCPHKLHFCDGRYAREDREQDQEPCRHYKNGGCQFLRSGANEETI